MVNGIDIGMNKSFAVTASKHNHRMTITKRSLMIEVLCIRGALAVVLFNEIHIEIL